MYIVYYSPLNLLDIGLIIIIIIITTSNSFKFSKLFTMITRIREYVLKFDTPKSCKQVSVKIKLNLNTYYVICFNELCRFNVIHNSNMLFVSMNCVSSMSYIIQIHLHTYYQCAERGCVILILIFNISHYVV